MDELPNREALNLPEFAFSPLALVLRTYCINNNIDPGRGLDYLNRGGTETGRNPPAVLAQALRGIVNRAPATNRDAVKRDLIRFVERISRFVDRTPTVDFPHEIFHSVLEGREPTDFEIEVTVAREFGFLPDLLLPIEVLRRSDTHADGAIVSAVATPWLAIVRALEHDPEFLYNISPRRLEEFIAAAYDKTGLFDEVILTPRSGDKGRDVIAANRSLRVRILEEVKAYKPGRVVTAQEVRALYGTLALDRDATSASLSTTASFAPRIAEEFKDVPSGQLELRDGTALRSWLLEVAQNEQDSELVRKSRLWTP